MKSVTKNYFYSLRILWMLLLIPTLLILTGCERKRTIVNGLDEKEANEIVVLLSTKGIEADKSKSLEGAGGGAQTITLWDVSVPEPESTAAMSILNNAGLPRRKSQNLLNIFTNTGLIPTDMGERIRYQAGLADQIASTIRNIDGILDAEVIISFPEEDPLNPNAPKKDITSSVYIKHNGILDDPNTHLASKIKNLIASSVSGLKYDNVTLIPVRARFSELPIGGNNAKSDEEKQFVSVWTVIVAKDSVTRFRVIFFTFCLLLLLMIIAIVWLAWKTFPLLKKQGGIKELFSLHAAKGHEKDTAPPSTESKEKKKLPTDDNSDSFADESADFAGDIDVSDDER